MSGNTSNREFGRALEGGWAAVPKVATGNFVDLGGKDFAVVRGFGAGTFKLPNVSADLIGTVVRVVADGAQTWTNAAAVTIRTLETGNVAFFTAATTSTWTATGAVVGDMAILDSADFFTVDQVEFALEQLGNQFQTVMGHIDIPLSAFREVDADGDVADIAANGGVLASDTTPVFEAVGTTNAWRYRWATGNADRIAASITLPADFDGTQDVSVDFIVSSAGTTNSFNTAVLVTNWDGGADVTDALVDTATTAVKAATGAVAAADVPDAPLCVTVSITPPTHATDALHVYGARIRYHKTFAVFVA